MINANKGMVKLEGTGIVLEAEVVTVVNALYKSLAKQYGEEFAKGRMERVFKAAMEEAQEDEDSVLEPLKSLLQGILEDVLSTLKGENKEGEE